jgi:hypothetical protein
MRKRKPLRHKKHTGTDNKQPLFQKGISPFQLFFAFYTARVK